MQQSSTQQVRIPPQNVDSERALLGSLMLRAESIYDVADIVQPESFYAEKHRIIFNAMMDLYEKKEPIDILSVSSRLTAKKHLGSVGGRTYLTELIDTVPSSSNAKYYAEIVQNKFILRNLIDASYFISELGYDEESEVLHLLDQAEKKLFGITGLTSSRKFTRIRDGLEEAWERLEKLQKSDSKIRGVPTGYKKLDSLLSGFQKSDLVVLAARPSMGKTALALDIARLAACKHNIPVGIFSLEMSSQQLVDRMLAAESRVDAWRLRTGQQLSDGDFASIQGSLGTLSDAPIFIDDTPSNSILQMRSTARRLKREHGLELIVVDYLQLITTSRPYDSMVQQVTEISRSLKSLARELDTPVVALSQLNRAIEQRRDKPRLSDLRDSGSIEQDSDVVLFIHSDDRYRDDEEKTNITDIMVAKHRNGPLGNVQLYFDNKRVTFVDLADRGKEIPTQKEEGGSPDEAFDNEDEF